MNAPMIPNLMLAGLHELTVSKSPVQALRRQRFTEASLQELAESFGNDVGIVEPLIARRIDGNPSLEIIAGERRYLAARIAGIDKVPVIVRDLDDAQALEIQMIENLQRSDFQPLEEAAGFRELTRLKQIGATEVAELLGKSRSYVYARIKLLDLCPAAQAAMQAGQLDASKGLLLARIPGHKLQKKALELLLAEGHYYSFRRLFDKLREKFMAKLSAAPFALDDPTLSITDDKKVLRDVQPYPAACTACPHNSANDPELRAELDGEPGAHICTHAPCYEFKVTVYWQRRRQEAEASGQPVITGEAARAVLPDRWNTFGYIDLDEQIDDMDPPANLTEEQQDNWQPPTWRQLLGDRAPATVLIEDPHRGGALRGLAPLADVRKAVKAVGVKLNKWILDHHDRAPDDAAAGSDREQDSEALRLQREKEALRESIEVEYRKRLYLAVMAKWKGPLKKPELARLAELLEDYSSDDELIAEAFGGNLPDRDKASEPDLMRLVFALTFPDHEVRYTHNKPGRLLEYAGRLKIDAKKLRASVAAELTPKTEKAAPAKKAASKAQKK